MKHVILMPAEIEREDGMNVFGWVAYSVRSRFYLYEGTEAGNTHELGLGDVLAWGRTREDVVAKLGDADREALGV